ncbi:MAG: 50S ribosomal protein L23 [Gemmatimonadetes bacterium]|nr:50S ribosomal protein L23 [Gemmatimonadota bacterium]
MLDPREVIRRPIVTEKTTAQQEALRRYAFEVTPEATKREIAHAVESLFSVRVESVRTMRYRGKTRRARFARLPGRRPAWKKAVVTLAEGESIPLFETA